MLMFLLLLLLMMKLTLLLLNVLALKPKKKIFETNEKELVIEYVLKEVRQSAILKTAENTRLLKAIHFL